MKPKGAGVLYLLKDRFQLYTNSFPDILEFYFSSDAVSNVNLINKALFIREITAFIDKYTLSPNNLIIIISDEASWSKDLQPTEIALTENDALAQIKPFTEKNPYGHAIHKTLTTPNGIKMFATNQDIYLAIKEAFEEKDFSVEYIFPACVFSNNISANHALSVEGAGIVFKEALSKQDDNLFKKSTDQEVLDKAQSKRDILRLYALVNVFGVVIIAVVVAWQITHPMPSQDYRGKAAPEQTKAPSQSIQVQVEEAKQRTVQIVYGQNTAQQAKLLKEVLQNYKFKAITLTSQTAPIKTKNMILFSSRTSQALRNSIITEVKKTVPDISAHENTSATSDITIILGN